LELAVILLIAILLFGAQKIPKLARSTGQAMGEFRRGREEIEQELEELEEGPNIDESVNTGTSGRPDQPGGGQPNQPAAGQSQPAENTGGTTESTSTDGGSAGENTEDEA
jgi:sec-independent protein translocase protein TatA